METHSYYDVVDKTTWPEGPWKQEPDKIQWPDAVTGLPCLLVRNSTLGNWCGYVGVPSSHPLHGKGCNDAACDNLDAHGGITHTGPCDASGLQIRPAQGGPKGMPAQPTVCHVPDPGEPDDVWWFGFDAAHCDDLSPGLGSRRMGVPFEALVASGEYRDQAYMQQECADLALSLKACEAALMRA